MASCLDIVPCASDKRLYNIPCRFALGLNLYVCNDKTTCTNTNGRRDCCAYNVADCMVLESSLRLPTFQPTQAVDKNLCNPKTCPAKYDTDQCYWYESINTDLLCSENNDEYCCSQHRSDCCQTSRNAVIIVFGCIAAFIVLLIWYRTIMGARIKIIPMKAPSVKEQHNKYQIVATV
jgi:hypothetical protein